MTIRPPAFLSHLVLAGTIFAGANLSAASADAAPSAIAIVAANEARALATLRQALAQENGWIKVHAAEVLIFHGEGKAVYATFLEEDKFHATELRYRSGIWRTLARVAPTPAERVAWKAKIAAVFTDVTAPDRLHALESLAKLGPPHAPAVVAAATAWLPTATPEDAVFLHWLLWQSGAAESRAYIVSQLASPVRDARLRAAYILRLAAAGDDPTLAALAQAADREPADSPARVYIVGAAYATRADGDRFEAWRDILEGYVTHGNTAEVYHALQALMMFYHVPDLERIAPLLTNPEGDKRIGAAWTFLFVND